MPKRKVVRVRSKAFTGRSKSVMGRRKTIMTRRKEIMTRSKEIMTGSKEIMTRRMKGKTLLRPQHPISFRLTVAFHTRSYKSFFKNRFPVSTYHSVNPAAVSGIFPGV